MIKVKKVTKKYGSFIAVRNLNFEIKQGEIVGLLGPNGAGKSTTMNMITGFIEPTEGEISVDGVDICKNPKKAKRQIGYMPENVPLYTDLTPKEFISYMAELKMVPRSERKAQVEKLIRETGLEEVQNKLIRNLSRGYKQRVSLAGALAGNPKVLILDEPTIGLDPKQITEIRNLIRNLGKEHTIIISSHILSEISQICEKVIIINQGEIVAIDTIENIENRVSKKNCLLVTVEEKEKSLGDLKGKIQGIEEIELVKEREDGSKQYQITYQEGKDLRKQLLENLAKQEINLLEMKNAQGTLEDAFMELIQEKEYKEKQKGGEN